MTLRWLNSKTRSRPLMIPALCLVLAVALLYVKPFLAGRIFHYPVSMPVLSESRPDTDITILYHERPPYYVTGPLGIYGLCVDPVKKAFSAADIGVEWVKMPAARQLEMLKSNAKNICAIGWFKNPERKKFAVYSHAIYQDKPMIALARSDNLRLISQRSLAQTLENEAVTLLRKDGYSYGQYIDDMILKHGPRQEITTAENIGMLKILHDGLADYFFISEEEAAELIHTSGLLADTFQFIRFTDVPAGNKRYLLFSKSTDKRIVDRVDAAIIQVRAGSAKEE
ncbi:MAG: substrate-binding periplasmic protein [Thermodesulfobacteriota bacterium]